jgi:hypothetical protein
MVDSCRWREVGVSRSAANNWARGHKSYRGGEVVGFVPALDRLAVRQVSPRLLEPAVDFVIVHKLDRLARDRADERGGGLVIAEANVQRQLWPLDGAVTFLIGGDASLARTEDRRYHKCSACGR